MWGSHTTVRSTRDASAERSGSDRVSTDEHAELIPVAAQGGRVVHLGDFEDGLDGWRGGEGVDLAQVAQTDRPGVVSSGSKALEIDCSGPAAATITNEQRARDADWLDQPFLTATIMPGTLAGTDAPIHASFGLVHAAGTRGRGRPIGAGGRNGSRAHTGRGRGNERRHGRLTSETFSAPQGQPVRLYWDLSDVDERVLDAVVRLELVCERADQPVDEGPYGRGGATGIRGPIYVDDITLSDSPDTITAARLQTHWQQLVLALGSHTETVTEVKKTSVASGHFVFEDGTADYHFRLHEDGRQSFTLGEQTYHFADGMAAVQRE